MENNPDTGGPQKVIIRINYRDMQIPKGADKRRKLFLA